MTRVTATIALTAVIAACGGEERREAPRSVLNRYERAIDAEHVGGRCWIVDEPSDVYYCELDREQSFNNVATNKVCIAFGADETGKGVLTAAAEEADDCDGLVRDD